MRIVALFIVLATSMVSAQTSIPVSRLDGQTFTSELARDILLTALKMNGRFYVLIAFEGTQAKIRSEFSFQNWFAESLEVAEPSPLWVKTPKVRSR